MAKSSVRGNTASNVKGNTAGWNKNTRTGWRKEGGKWVQYKKGVRTGQTRKHKLETNVLGSAVVDTWRGATSGLASGKTGDNRRSLEIARKKVRKQRQESNQKSTTPNTSSNKVIRKSVGTVDFNVATPEGRAAYEKALKASRTNKAKTNQEKDKSTTEALYGERNRKEAAKRKLRPKPGSAGARIQQKLKDAGHTQEGLDATVARHRAWKAARKSGTLGDWEKKYHPDRTPKYKNKKKLKTNK
tara:strand:+ start:153 stop:884 length:732 start_codon:yes stop_codon:yes gene_type:complete